jgi:hypothetical protein
MKGESRLWKDSHINRVRDARGNYSERRKREHVKLNSIGEDTRGCYQEEVGTGQKEVPLPA